VQTRVIMYFSITAFAASLFAWRKNAVTFDQANEVRMGQEREAGERHAVGEGGWDSVGSNSSDRIAVSEDLAVRASERVEVALEKDMLDNRRESFMDAGHFSGQDCCKCENGYLRVNDTDFRISKEPSF
jgi:hypothetical protein